MFSLKLVKLSGEAKLCLNKVNTLLCLHQSSSKFSHMDDAEGNLERERYISRASKESIDSKRARLIYQSRKRGILENDLLLASFAKKYLTQMDASELDEYDRLINTTSNEWDIYYWAVGAKPVPPQFQGKIMDKLVLLARNEHREQRFKQPNLD